jgi:simple sugar transport system substrate-binding protein
MTYRGLKGLLLALAAIAALLLVACGGNDNSAKTGGASTAGGGASTAGNGNIKIVFVSHAQAADPFHSIIKKGAEAAAKELGVKFTFVGLEKFDLAKMAQNIDAAIASKPDGLIVSDPDSDVIGPKIQEAVDKGIPVVVADFANEQKRGALAYVGSNENDAGIQGGQRMRAAGVKHALCVNPEVGNVVLDVRCNAFSKGLGGKTDVLGVDLNDPTAVQQRIEATLKARPDVDGIITLWAQGSDSAVAALEHVGKESSVKLATFDLSPEALTGVKDGKIQFAIDQQPYMRGYLPVLFLEKFKELGVSAVGAVPTGPMFITKDNAPQVFDLSQRGLR